MRDHLENPSLLFPLPPPAPLSSPQCPLSFFPAICPSDLHVLPDFFTYTLDEFTVGLTIEYLIGVSPLVTAIPTDRMNKYRLGVCELMCMYTHKYTLHIHAHKQNMPVSI